MNVKRRMRQRAAAKAGDRAEKALRCQKVYDSLALMRERLTVHMIDADRISPAVGEEDTRYSDELLRTSVKKIGLLEPLTVRRVSKDDSPIGGLFTLLSGSRRFDALKRNGMTRVPCFIYDIQASSAVIARLSSLLTAEKSDIFLCADLLREAVVCASGGLRTVGEALGTSAAKLQLLLNCASFRDEERAVCRKYRLPDELILRIGAIGGTAARKRAIADCAACLKYLYDAYDGERDAKRRGVLRDLLPVLNGVARLTAQIRSAGYAARASRSETDDEFVITMRVPKRSVRTLALHERDRGA